LYPGLFKVIEITKKLFQGVPKILGGIYATLCYEHAKKHSGVDIVFKSGNEFDAIKLISELTGFQLRTPNSKLRTDKFLNPCFYSSEFRTPNSQLIYSHIPLSTFILNSIMFVSLPQGGAHFIAPIVLLISYQEALQEGIPSKLWKRLNIGQPHTASITSHSTMTPF
jgi:hypothetical protein